MRAIILAAGRGSRMGKYTEERPKCLTELGGAPLLDRQLQSLREGGATEIAIVTGYYRDQLVKEGVLNFHNDRWSETNMVMTLAEAREWLCQGDCLVSYSDIFYGPQVIRDLIGSGGKLAISYDPDWLSIWSRRFDDPLSDAETFQLNESGLLREIGKKANTLEEIKGQYMGLLKFTPESWAWVESVLQELPPKRREKLDMTSLLGLLLERQCEIEVVANRQPWGEVDSADDLGVYEKMIVSGEIKLP